MNGPSFQRDRTFFAATVRGELENGQEFSRLANQVRWTRSMPPCERRYSPESRHTLKG